MESCLTRDDSKRIVGADDIVSEQLRDATSRNTCATGDTNKWRRAAVTAVQ
jgi:hypothetical protein